MIKIGLLSDTHSYLDPKIFKYFNECNEIWHAGDIGSMSILDQLKEFKLVRAVYGNIDSQIIRKECPKHQRFICEKVNVWMTHIGGYPNNYSPSIRKEIKENPPKLFISGHSHILKIIYDKKLSLLHINPGACGKNGFHKVRTLIRFSIDGSEIKNLEIIELGKH